MRFFTTPSGGNAITQSMTLGNTGALILNGVSATAPIADNTQQVATTAFVTANAAPLDAMAYSGIQINGNADISQEIGASSVTVTATGTSIVRPCDGWVGVVVSTLAPNVTIGQFLNFTSAPYINVLRVNPNAGFAGSTAGDTIFLRQTVEGSWLARLGWGTNGGWVQPLSYAMQFYSTAPGTIFVRLFNAAQTRAFYKNMW